MNTSDPIVGTVYDGRYRIIERIGQGGMANVYLAEDETLGRRVAIKVLHERYAADQQFVERFLREASAAARLNHPNIVQVYDRGQSGQTYYIAMEYIDGMTLKELIQRRGKLTEAEILGYSKQALSALRFAHRNGIVHRDIKPHNMMVDHEGRLKIADFGIARAGADSGLTEAGSIVGTAQYLSPEQARGLDVAAPSDLYSCGVVMYEMATGTVPFDGESPVTVALKHVNDPVDRPGERAPGLSPAIEAVILRAMQKDPARRYGSAEEMVHDLDTARQGAVSSDTAAITRVVTAPAVMAGVGATTIQPGGMQPPPRRADVGAGYSAASSYAGYQPDEDEDEPKSRRWMWILLLIAVLAVGGLAAWALSSDKPETPQVSVPDVVGKSESSARRAITQADLEVGSVDPENSEKPEGTVLEQSPSDGEMVDKGSEVDLVISAGPKPATVPDVVGLARVDAEKQISDAGLKRTARGEFSDEVEKGTVISQSPAGGKDVPKGSMVTLVISKGTEEFDVPNVVGLSESEARAKLTSAGYEDAKISVTEEDGPDPAGEVTAQNPSSGTATPEDSITLTVASGKNVIPDVAGETEADARAALEEAGFTVGNVSSLPEDPSLPAGSEPTVSKTAPPGTLRRPVGTTINITLTTPPA